MIEIYGNNSFFCEKAKEICTREEFDFVYKELGIDFDEDEILKLFGPPSSLIDNTLPQIMVNKEHIGGIDEFEELVDQGIIGDNGILHAPIK